RSESAQHVVDGFLAWRTDADAEAGIFGRAQVILNVPQPVVAAVGPAGTCSQLAKRQVEIIAHDEQVLGWQLVEVHQLTNALPAQVHEGLRSHQQDLLGAFPRLGDLGLKSRLKTPNIRPGRERVYHGESNIMARAVIAAARIAKADHRLHFGEW